MKKLFENFKKDWFFTVFGLFLIVLGFINFYPYEVDIWDAEDWFKFLGIIVMGAMMCGMHVPNFLKGIFSKFIGSVGSEGRLNRRARRKNEN